MDNVVSFKRKRQTVKEDLLKEIDKIDFEKGAFLLYYDPDFSDDTKEVQFTTNMTPGTQELLIFSYVLRFLENMIFSMEYYDYDGE